MTNNKTQLFAEWRQGKSLAEALTQLEEAVRKAPADVTHRWALFEILCVLEQWERALQALQLCAQMQPSLTATAHALRGLIRAEREREQVFAAQATPAPVVDYPQWMADLVAAIGHNLRGEHEQADTLRHHALSQAPQGAGDSNFGRFAWLTDSDTRLSPVCEIIVTGAYRWLAFADIAELILQPPKRLLDLIWAPVEVQLQLGAGAAQSQDDAELTGIAFHGYIPVRYPAMRDNVTADDADDLLLARKTVWDTVGETGVFASGQKTLMTDVGDWSLLELRYCRFDSVLPGAAAND